MRLRRAEASVRAGDWTVGERNLAHEARIGAGIEVSKTVAQTRRDAEAGSVGAGVQRARGVDGGNSAVALESHADSSCGCVTPFPTAQLFLLRVSHAHGLARFAGQQRRDRPQPRLVFAAKAAAQVRTDHPYLIVSPSKDLSEFV